MFQPIMANIRRWPTLQKKCFTCIVCMCCLARVKTLVFEICFVRSTRIFWLIIILLWIPVMVVFLHSRSSALCWSWVCGQNCGVVCNVFLVNWCLVVTTTPPTHTGPTQYRRSTVREQDHYWDSQQDYNQSKNSITFNKTYFKY
jgi:hypothetical protein